MKTLDNSGVSLLGQLVTVGVSVLLVAGVASSLLLTKKVEITSAQQNSLKSNNHLVETILRDTRNCGCFLSESFSTQNVHYPNAQTLFDEVIRVSDVSKFNSDCSGRIETLLSEGMATQDREISVESIRLTYFEQIQNERFIAKLITSYRTGSTSFGGDLIERSVDLNLLASDLGGSMYKIEACSTGEISLSSEGPRFYAVSFDVSTTGIVDPTDSLYCDLDLLSGTTNCVGAVTASNINFIANHRFKSVVNTSASTSVKDYGTTPVGGVQQGWRSSFELAPAASPNSLRVHIHYESSGGPSQLNDYAVVSGVAFKYE